MERSVLLLPIFDVRRGQRTADAIVVNTIADDIRTTGVNVPEPIVTVAAAKRLRVTVAIQVERPLSELEMLFGLRGAIEDLCLQVLVFVEAREGEGCSCDQQHTRDKGYQSRSR